MKLYQGIRTPTGCRVTVQETKRRGKIYPLPRPLPLRLDVDNHSPTGFEWGYGGSGPAQLALAILCDYLCDPKRAAELHQPFKWAVIARLENDTWSLSGFQIHQWLSAQT